MHTSEHSAVQCAAASFVLSSSARVRSLVKAKFLHPRAHPPRNFSSTCEQNSRFVPLSVDVVRPKESTTRSIYLLPRIYTTSPSFPSPPAPLSPPRLRTSPQMTPPNARTIQPPPRSVLAVSGDAEGRKSVEERETRRRVRRFEIDCRRRFPSKSPSANENQRK